MTTDNRRAPRFGPRQVMDVCLTCYGCAYLHFDAEGHYACSSSLLPEKSPRRVDFDLRPIPLPECPYLGGGEAA